MDFAVGPAYGEPESPTQVNEDRSYDRYDDPASLPSINLQPIEEGEDGEAAATTAAADDFLDRSLDENESGAVNFGSLDSGGLDVESPMASDGDRRRTNGLAHFFPPSDNDPADEGAAARTGLAPETPAAAATRNPFAGKFQTPLVAGSQLFAQTPFSAVFNQASPTSSRPSPSGLPAHLVAAGAATASTPYAGLSSALKHRFPSNPDDQTTPMPLPMFNMLSTSSQSRFEGATPFPFPAVVDTAAEIGPAGLQPSSSPTARRRRPAAPIEEYEPMRQSQERRNAAASSERRPDQRSSNSGGGGGGGGFGSSSEDDAADASQRRQKRQRAVRRKKEEATRILSTIRISMSGPTFRDDSVEVPASTRKGTPPLLLPPPPPPPPADRRADSKPPSSQALEACPESDPPVVATSEAAATAVAAVAAVPVEKALADGPPRSSLPESDMYEDLSFPQSLVDAYGANGLPAAKTPSSSAVLLPEIAATVKQNRPPLHPRSSLNEADTIPETSPAAKRRAETARSPIRISSDAPDIPKVHAPPGSPGQVLRSPQAQAVFPSSPGHGQHSLQTPGGPVADALSLLKEDARQVVDITDDATSSPPVPASLAYNTRQRLRRQPRGDRDDGCGEGKAAQHGRASLAMSISSAGRSVSSLSSLSATPQPASRDGSPITANDSDRSARGSDQKHNATTASATAPMAVEDDDDSPLVPRKRRRHHEARSLPSLVTPEEPGSPSGKAPVPTRRGRSPFPLSGSTDELAASPASFAVPERRTRSSRTFVRSTSARTATATALASGTHRRESAAPPGLFSGMLFSVTFQSKRRGESDSDFAKREKQGEALQARIREEGGRILPDGFDALFRKPHMVSAAARLRTATAASAGSEQLELLPADAGTGFTALISDGHSRKAKYMQALALGLPCLAPRWATACLERGTLVDWSPYLLCAGESSFLGGAIRSRSLVAYDAATARLADVVRARCRLLAGLAILVVLRKAARGEAYIFLAHVLGASLSRADSVQDARDQLRAMEDAGRPFDWVYTDQEAELNRVFYERAARPAAKRRKRHTLPLANNGSDRAPAAVKILSDERFIQSLIFGKLIEEDDFGT